MGIVKCGAVCGCGVMLVDGCGAGGGVEVLSIVVGVD